MPVSCDEYTFAIERKVAIASYHLECLNSLLARNETMDPVPIPIQAHFEGLVMSTIACADQVAAGLWHLRGFGAKRRGLDNTFRDPAVAEVSDDEPWRSLKKLWYDAAMLDVRDLRRRMSHLYYDKAGRGGHYYIHEYEFDTQDVLGGEPIADREILAFSNSAFDLLRHLGSSGTTVLMSYH